MIWVVRKQEYFYKQDWTGEIKLKLKENFTRRASRDAPFHTLRAAGFVMPQAAIAAISSEISTL